MEATSGPAAACRPANVVATYLTKNNSSKWAARLSPPATAARTSSSITTTCSYSLFSARNSLTRKPFPTRCLERDFGSSSSTDEEGANHHQPVPSNHASATDPKQQPPTSAGLSISPSSSSRHGLVFDVGPSHSWDSHEVGSPVIKRYVGDDKERWFMWYHGAGGGGDGDRDSSIGLAVSNNGVHWERGPGPVTTTGDDVGPVMRRSTDWWAFDTQLITPSEVLIMSSDKLRAPGVAVYWLYYTGVSLEKVEIPSMSPKAPAGILFKSLPGLAISQDGRHWARIEGEHHSGALFDVGAAGQWDSLFVAAPKVVYHARGDLRMSYHSWDPMCGRYAIGMARSRDGIKWVKLGKVLGGGPAGSFDEAGVRNGHVVRMNTERGYLMAYEGVSTDGRTSIGLAVSSDGLKDWRRCGDQAVLKPSIEEEDGWDNRGVGDPCLVRIDGDGGDEWRLYYRGICRDGRTGIGLAVSQGGHGLASFERWTGFHL